MTPFMTPLSATAIGTTADLPGTSTTPHPAMPEVRQAGAVMAYTQGLRGYASEHEQMTRMEVVRRLARLKGYGVAEEFAGPPLGTRIYLVPSDTLVGAERARALGIQGRNDFFGGVVPHAFVATKAISHGLVAPDARAPQGWNPDFGRQVGDAVLPGYTAFTLDDARTAAHLLLADGPARLKCVRATGGHGQTVVPDLATLEACLATLDPDSVGQDGVVLERNLAGVETLSVGQVHVAGIVASYYGTQRLVRDHLGEEVYGGSDLTVVRGDFHALLSRPLPDAVRTAVEQALLYDSAAVACFPGLMASRINYDVARGRMPDGSLRSGVLEQSWRVGGATGAEIAALELLQADPAHHVVCAGTHEVYGPSELPDGAVVYFRGTDQQVGQLTKYSLVTSCDDHPT